MIMVGAVRGAGDNPDETGMRLPGDGGEPRPVVGRGRARWTGELPQASGS